MFLFILIHLHLARKNVFKEVVDGQESFFSLFNISLLLLFLPFTSTSFLSVFLLRKKK